MSAAHWAVTYIGESWVPRQNDCWSFCRKVWRDRFGFDVPEMPISPFHLREVAHAMQQHDERANWVEVAEPGEGDAVLMAYNRFPVHVGVWVAADGGGLLHCEQKTGVIFSNRAALARMGITRMWYFRRAA